MSAIISASTLRLPTWALVELRAGRTSDGRTWPSARRAPTRARKILLFDAPADAAEAIEAVVGVLGEAKVGVVLANSAADVDAWAEAAKRLVAGGAHVLGGGPGTTTLHMAALARSLHGPRTASIRPEMPKPRAG